MLVGVVLLISCLVASPVPKGMIHYGRVPTSVRHVYYAVTDDDSEEMTLKEVMKIAKKVDLLKEIMRYDTVEDFKNNFAEKRKQWKGFKVPRVIDESKIPHIMATLGYDTEDLENRGPMRMMKVCRIGTVPSNVPSVRMIREAPMLYDTTENVGFDREDAENSFLSDLAYLSGIISKPGFAMMSHYNAEESSESLLSELSKKLNTSRSKSKFSQFKPKMMIARTYPFKGDGSLTIRM